MWNSNLHYKLLEKGAGKYEGSEESEVSSQGTESSQQETENLAHLTQRIDQWVRRERRFRKCGPRAEAENGLVPVYREELRKVLLEYLRWLRAVKKDPTFHKVIETQREFEDTEGFD